MTSKTNPLINRFDQSVGWKTSNFPQSASCYARDAVFFFKLYLFLSAFFKLRRIKLISYEIRASENNTQILYLVINTAIWRKKRRLRKKFRRFKRLATKTKSSRYHASPYSNPVNWKIKYLLYLQPKILKKKIKYQILPLIKQKPTNNWLTKSRTISWFNWLLQLRLQRKHTKQRTIQINFKPHKIRITPWKKKYHWQMKIKLALKQRQFLKKFIQIFSKIPQINLNIIQWYNKKFLKLTKLIKKNKKLLNQYKEKQNQPSKTTKKVPLKTSIYLKKLNYKKKIIILDHSKKLKLKSIQQQQKPKSLLFRLKNNVQIVLYESANTKIKRKKPKIKKSKYKKIRSRYFFLLKKKDKVFFNKVKKLPKTLNKQITLKSINKKKQHNLLLLKLILTLKKTDLNPANISIYNKVWQDLLKKTKKKKKN